MPRTASPRPPAPRRLRTVRALAALIALACLTVGLTACGGSGNAEPTGETRTVTDVEGTEMLVPADPSGSSP